MSNKELNKEKLKALQLTMEKLDKTYGKGSVMKLGDAPVEKIDVIPTGSLTLDLALVFKIYLRVEWLKFMVRNPLVKQP